MNESEKRAEIIADIQTRMSYLIETDEISEEEKIKIVRKVLHLIEHGKMAEYVGSELWIQE